MESSHRQPDINMWNLGNILWHLEHCQYSKSLGRKRLPGVEGSRKEAEFWGKSTSNL